MGLQRVKGMPEQPNACACCGSTPVNDDGTYKEAIFAEGVDIDWGNSLYICWECAELIADLIGRATRGGFDKLAEQLETLRAEHAELLEAHERQEELVEKIREGAKAQKAIRN